MGFDGCLAELILFHLTVYI